MKRRALFALLLLTLPLAAKPPAAVYQATIAESSAPWDGLAYELLIPLPPDGQSNHPVVRVQLWGNPQFEKSTTLTITPTGGSNEPGRASYQTQLNQSLPQPLQGTITFQCLKKQGPVEGSLQLTGPKGLTVSGAFSARWGVSQLPRRIP